MPMLIQGETAAKIVLLGPRGAASHVLARRPDGWSIERWYDEVGLGEPGEPPMDLTSFHVGREVGDQRYRLYFFGHGIAAHDFAVLGGETRRAIFTRMDRLVVVLDGHDDAFAACLAGDRTVPTACATAIGVRGFRGGELTIGVHSVAVTPLGDAEIATWLERLATETIAGRTDSPGGALSGTT